MQTDEREASTRMETAFERAGLTVPSATEVVKGSGIDPARSRTLMQLLLREKRLIRVSEDLVFHASAIEELKATLSKRKGERFSVADFKEWTGVSRKYAIPLLEWLDSQRITRRDGDARRVRCERIVPCFRPSWEPSRIIHRGLLSNTYPRRWYRTRSRRRRCTCRRCNGCEHQMAPH